MNIEHIKSALAAISTGDFLETSTALLAALGYRSELTLELSGTMADFLHAFPAPNPNTRTEQAFQNAVDSARLIFQFTPDEIASSTQQTLDFLQEGYADSFLFFAVELKQDNYPRSKYAEFTREINKRLLAPTIVLFHAGNHLTIGFAGRRPHHYDANRDVLEKVTLIKDIRLEKPHRAHLDILANLSLTACVNWIADNNQPKNFDGLLAAWLAKLDTEELNKAFYRRLFNWFEWAVEEATFPTNETVTLTPQEHVIRLITRLLFVWFLKEKGWIADALFHKTQIGPLLNDTDDSYYRAVLQNLFFATLNTAIDTRGFSKGTHAEHRNFSRYRYANEIRDREKLLALFAQTPFINGGLFECLDSEKGTNEGGYRIDCFSDVHFHKVSIPNRLFFDAQRGLFPLLKHYKFTVEENTPIEQEVALDPELLGKVFENLLAAYNPETGATARKQTGSFYTPREIVDYMVDEALVAVFTQKCTPTGGEPKSWDKRLRDLLDYAQTDANESFDAEETDSLVRTISELKILDPGVGSGAFPMGMLHKLTLVLRRLDADNSRWERLQKERAQQRAAAAFDTTDDDTRREELLEIDKTFKRYRDSDFGRKLYLIQNCIYGVDIQPVACQIAKLRFFISLAIEQEPDSEAENFGIRPLPNLETRFLAANTLLGLTGELMLTSEATRDLERKLRDNRERHFHATTRKQKRACKEQDEALRAALSAELETIGMPAEDAEKIAHWHPYAQNTTADWFDAERMFGIREGFDIVIGNPPYVQLQKNGGALGRFYQNAGFETFARTGDIYCLFYERGIRLLASDGHLCYITSNKWMRAGYGKALRHFFVENVHPIKLLDLGPDIFDATVDTNILLCSRTRTSPVARGVARGPVSRGAATPTVPVARGPVPRGAATPTVPVARGPVPREAIACTVNEKYKHTATTLAAYTAENGVHFPLPEPGAQWVILSDIERQIHAKIEAVGTPLKDWDISIYRGIVTGYNTAFLIDDETKEALVKADPKSAEIIKPVLRGRDVNRYHAKWANLWRIDTHNGYGDVPAIDVNNYRAVKAHLDAFYPRLEKRHNKGNTPYNLCNCVYHAEFAKPKVIYPETTHAANFFYDDGKYFIEKTCFMITGRDLKILVGLLSSTLLTFAYKRFYSGTVLGKKGYQYNKHSLERLPVVQIPVAEQASFIALVDAILAAKAADSGAETADLEKKLDERIYAWYNLTQDEISVVEG